MCAVLLAWHVRDGFFQRGKKRRFESCGAIRKQVLRKLQNASGIRNHLHGLNTRDVVKEPTPTCVHQLRVTLHLHQLESAIALFSAQRMALLRFEEAVGGFIVTVEDYIDVGVAGGPYILKQLHSLGLSKRDQGIAQRVERLAQRLAPCLVPARAATVATAVGAPSLNAVNAGPGAVLYDLAFMIRWKLREEAAVVCQMYSFVLVQELDGVGQRHLAVSVMVAVALSIGGDV